MIRYLVGAHGTGKSTLLEALKEKFPSTFYSEGVTRPIVRALRTVQIQDSVVEQELIDELTISAYLNQISNSDVLCTRSIIDLVVYHKVFNPGDSERINKFMEIWRETQNNIDVLIYTPIEFPLATDDIRKGVFGNPEIQKRIDLEFQKFIAMHVGSNIEVVKVNGTVEERIKKVEKYFKK